MKGNPRPLRGRQADLSHRAYDIAGITLIALGLIVAVSLAMSNAGMLGDALGGFMRMLFGKGAWSVPVLLLLLGSALIAGKRSIEISHLSAGLGILFLAVIGAIARPLAGDYFDLTAATGSGGYLGALVGWGLESLLGAAKPVGIGALGMIGLVLCVRTPIAAMLAAAKERAASVKPRRGSPTLPKTRPERRAVVQVPEPSNHATSTAPADERKTRPMPVVRETQQLSLSIDSPENKEGYNLPPMSLLAEPPAKAKRSPHDMQVNIETLEGTLEEFGIDANVVEIANGPTITRYEIQLGPGIRVARITALADNIAMNLAASHVRVEAPIPGKAAIGVEVPNPTRTMVALREVCDTKDFREHPSRIAFALGQDVSGVNQYADLARMPHLLIGGATNSGKSIGLATVITSLLMRNTPKDVRFVMIDPKRVELSLFDGIPHLMCPVIKDVKEAPGVLRAVWREMDRRYDLLSEHGVRNIDGWNAKASFQDKLPYIVVVIDELADLMIQAAAEVETSICRLAQLARAVGIHLVIATQRPSVDVITGTIKANIASRIAFAVSSQIDSRTILDQKGAEALIGRGDMLFMPIDASKPMRIQGCYVSEKEIEDVCNFWREQEKPAYVLNPVEYAATEGGGRSGGGGDDDHDALWEDAVRWVVDRGQASTSMMQRRFSIGFQRASRLLDMMEERGIVGPRDGPRPREVLIDPSQVDGMFGRRGAEVPAGFAEDEDDAEGW
ncbi:MAG: DNA translocase FtsK [Fimbriimonadales bacterium]